ncbi:MAG: glycogen/starch synthase [Acidimicrobiia bacterium]|nr:glycogen/starch synthase [Acidimicrobiia bacterium]
MRVLYATAELAPVASVGGLAQAAAGLTAELRRQGVDVDIVMPDYGGAELAEQSSHELAVPAWAGPAGVRVGDHAVAGRLHLVSGPGLARPHPYLQSDGTGWPDNDLRFLAFAQAVAALAREDPPDVLHLNDWHTATVLAAFQVAPPTVLSIHNLAYQGVTTGHWTSGMGPRAHHYEWYGNTNPLSGGIALADAVVAVSPSYADEIRTPVGGFGLDALLRFRGAGLVGILNGIDTDVWNPAVDAHLPTTYAVTDPAAIAGAKTANRAALGARCGWPDDGVPLVTMVTRLTGQKGVDLVAPVVPVLAEIPLRLAVLGAGDAALAGALAALATDHPGSFAFVERYDEALAHQLFGGGDLYLMPSRFEPCGLAQMQAMRYGTIPVVTAVGGLRDTVPDVDSRADGNGVVASSPEPVAITAALFRAARLLADGDRRVALVQRLMGLDWSWRAPAAEHVDLYTRIAV